MKKSFLLLSVVSLTLNVALGWLLFSGLNSPPPPAPAPVAPRPVSAIASAEATIDPDVWPSLQTEELPTLIARLRATGFPPDVIRAIIAAHFTEIYAARRKALDPDADSPAFWKNRSPDAKRDAALRQLGREQEKQIRDLLGDDDSDPMTQDYRQRRLSGVPPGKTDQVRQLLDEYDEKRSEVTGNGPPYEREKIAALANAQHVALARLLTPAELAEYDLRHSNVASQLRDQLSAFNSTEAEFRQIYQLRESFADRLAPVTTQPSGDEMRARSEAQKQLTEQIKAALGPVRGEEYVRATDYNYRQTTQLVARLELPPETSNQIWSVQKDIQQRSEALTSDRSLAPDQRTQQLAALADEAKTKITATLGPRGFEAYQQYGGQWLRTLTPRTVGSPPNN